MERVEKSENFDSIALFSWRRKRRRCC